MSATRRDLIGNPGLQKEDLERKVRADEAIHRRKNVELQEEANRIAKQANRRATTANWISLIALVVSIVSAAAVFLSLVLAE